jgi:hypothetical protein
MVHTKHRIPWLILDVQTHGMTNLVDQFNAIDSVRTARGAAYFVHELEQNAGAPIRSHAQSRVNPEMQNREPFVCGPHENCHPDGPTFVGNGEKGLHARNVAHADAQSAILLVDFGHAVRVDRLLDADPYTMLVDVEEQQLLKGWTLFRS